MCVCSQNHGQAQCAAFSFQQTSGEIQPGTSSVPNDILATSPPPDPPLIAQFNQLSGEEALEEFLQRLVAADAASLNKLDDCGRDLLHLGCACVTCDK